MNNQDSPNGGSYRAAQGNLNTVISNPSVNINDTMNMNIQNMNSTSNNNQVNLNTISNNDVSKINNNVAEILLFKNCFNSGNVRSN